MIYMTLDLLLEQHSAMNAKIDESFDSVKNYREQS